MSIDDLMTGSTYGYLGALAAAAVFAVAWRIVTTPRRRPVTEPISATELAFLRSDIAPVVTALAVLRSNGRITADRHVDRAASAGPHADQFSEQMLERAAADPEHTVPSLYAASQDDLAALEERLSVRGLTRTRAERIRIRWGAAPAIAIMALGTGYFAYLVTQLSDRPDQIAPLAVMVPATAVYGVLVVPRLLRVDRLTRAGRRLLAAEQERLSYLEPAKQPAFATYGPAAVALSVALFGTGALWAVDGDYSTAVDLSGGSSGGDGGGCGASCGGDGGGCGGGCGGCGGCGG
ncbi:TIGR04222 domain-containing membrane protein [Mycobacterium sp. 21AC1]|uniref:TIGR04222 domain-containing membrane protein n=1 Tax=[Mycobacterium] appelbergii TaxID=2939269 RepID=UPI0029391680|nr:TIGR04222 domain-containing membrane protein [Mycobacterium sp. 21AC1]MDV3130347.1 TIGR04222 domain-containing membrane protein [Mycobacterium sp. 21AC1]